MAGPTRAEALADLIGVIRADYRAAITKEKVICGYCKGTGILGMRDKSRSKGGFDDDEGDSEAIVECHACEALGYVYQDAFDFDNVPDNVKPFITGFKAGPRGMLIPEMRSKDKAAAELIKCIGNGWQMPFARDAYGADAPVEPESAEITKEQMIRNYQRIAETADAATAMGAMKEIAKLKGWVDEEDNGVDNTPLTASDLAKLMQLALEKNPHAIPKAANADDAEDIMDPDGPPA